MTEIATLRPAIFPSEVLELVDRVLAAPNRRCRKLFLLAVVDFLSCCRTDFGEAADWLGLETAIKISGLTIDQILNCLSKTSDDERPDGRKFHLFALDYDVWKTFRSTADASDMSDTGCWRALCRSARDAKPLTATADARDLVRFVRDAVRITGLPVDFVLDELSTSDEDSVDQPARSIRGFDRFWIDQRDWQSVQATAPALDRQATLLCASRWGLGRQAGLDCPDRQGNAVAGMLSDQDRVVEAIRAFRTNPLQQIECLADRLDHWLQLTGGDERQAYAALRAGSIESVTTNLRIEAGAVLCSLDAIELGLRLSSSDAEQQVERLENALRARLGSWTARDLDREIAVLAKLDAIVGDGSDAQGANVRGRLDQLFAQYVQLNRDFRDDVRMGTIELTELQGENLGQLSLAEVEACIHVLELRNPDYAGLTERINLRAHQGQLDADHALLQSLEARLLSGDESFDETKSLRQRLGKVNVDQERRERLVQSLLSRQDLLT